MLMNSSPASESARAVGSSLREKPAPDFGEEARMGRQAGVGEQRHRIQLVQQHAARTRGSAGASVGSSSISCSQRAESRGDFLGLAGPIRKANSRPAGASGPGACPASQNASGQLAQPVSGAGGAAGADAGAVASQVRRVRGRLTWRRAYAAVAELYSGGAIFTVYPGRQMEQLTRREVALRVAAGALLSAAPSAAARR